MCFDTQDFEARRDDFHARFARVGHALREALFSMGGSLEALTISLAFSQRD